MWCNVSQRICNSSKTHLVREGRALTLLANAWLVIDTSPRKNLTYCLMSPLICVQPGQQPYLTTNRE